MKLTEKVKNLPSSPGVYLMKDSLDCIIYVGKAKNLKKRVQSYFQSSNSQSSKVTKLIKTLKKLDYILTDTEFEAFMLECKLIKQLKPMYNKKMKSPLAYPYIKIQMNERYPRIAITNKPLRNDQNLYFGPYTSKGTVERALQGIKEYFKILCKNPSVKNSACLNHSLGFCIGMCLDGSAAQQYKTIINKVIALLNGTDLNMLENLQHKMLAAADKFDFETAAKYRDHIEAINSLISREKVIGFTAENKNIVIVEKLSEGSIKLFLLKRNKVLFSEKFMLESTAIEQLRTMVKANIFTYFKNEAPHESLDVNSDEIDEAQIIYSYLKGHNCRYIVIPDQSIDSEDNNTDIDEALTKLFVL